MEDLVKMLQSYQPPQVTVKPLLPAEAEVVDSTRPPAQVTEVVSTAEQQSISRRIESVATTNEALGQFAEFASSDSEEEEDDDQMQIDDEKQTTRAWEENERDEAPYAYAGGPQRDSLATTTPPRATDFNQSARSASVAQEDEVMPLATTGGATTAAAARATEQHSQSRLEITTTSAVRSLLTTPEPDYAQLENQCRHTTGLVLMNFGRWRNAERTMDLASVNQLADRADVNSILIKRQEMRARLDVVYARLGLPILDAAYRQNASDADLQQKEQHIHAAYGIDAYSTGSQQDKTNGNGVVSMPTRYARPAYGVLVQNTYFRLLRASKSVSMDECSDDSVAASDLVASPERWGEVSPVGPRQLLPGTTGRCTSHRMVPSSRDALRGQ
ncbi:uncharacterized protein PITG_20859 [Phytophthora infestans T30-4]|uniref:Uncharacterized protein n=1 Tax=Phytophthora infestans (strain T30-4) TaxID=403677 RepID=D0P333_PHYIT|nr:uncharacterized protein PITG_20859 [Phytophthora infestans T30-4]EEY58805.1 conserved hypothetical protein [Phytophthora infestans T30-4]|eukprot:XP_002895296.1 conserved hypothetical protein [Phytophthora infestans T30-4]